jgi:hypothetical protein
MLASNRSPNAPDSPRNSPQSETRNNAKQETKELWTEKNDGVAWASAKPLRCPYVLLPPWQILFLTQSQTIPQRPGYHRQTPGYESVVSHRKQTPKPFLIARKLRKLTNNFPSD